MLRTLTSAWSWAKWSNSEHTVAYGLFALLIAWLEGRCGSLTLRSSRKISYSKMAGPGKDQNSEKEVSTEWVPHHLQVQLLQVEPHKSGTLCTLKSILQLNSPSGCCSYSFFPTFAGSSSAFVSFVLVFQIFMSYAEWNPKNSSLMRHSFPFRAGYKKGLFILTYPSLVTVFECSPRPNSSPDKADLEIFYEAASYSCPGIFFPALCSLTVGKSLNTLVSCSI